MKYYKSVLKKVEETNYKKGITTIDEKSGIYKSLIFLYTLAFAWFMVFQTLYLLSNLMVYIGYQESISNVNQPLFITSCVVFFVMIAALVFTFFKWQMLNFVLTVGGGIAQIIMVSKVDNFKLEIIEHSIFATKYFWRHHAPIILMMIFALGMLAIGISRRIHLRKDYNKALNALYTAYKEQNEGISNSEWIAHLEACDREISRTEEEKKSQKRGR